MTQFGAKSFFKSLLTGIRPKKDIFGDATWMKAYQIRKLFDRKRHKGLCFGNGLRMSESDSFKNSILIAPTGTGKTLRWLIRNILMCSGSVVVTDPSGEIYNATSGRMAQRGYDIKVFDPANPLKSDSWNIMKRSKSVQDLSTLATMLSLQCEKNTSHWNGGAADLLFFLLYALSEMGKEKGNEMVANLMNLKFLINNFGMDGKRVQPFIERFIKDDFVYSEFTAFIEQEEAQKSGWASTARIALNLWRDPNVRLVTCSDSIQFEDLRKKKSIIYLRIDEADVGYFAPLLNLFYSDCFRYCLKNPQGNPVYFFLDEFGNLGEIYNFSSIANTLRKRRCVLNPIIQDLSQLEDVYGKPKATAIFNGGMGTKIFFHSITGSLGSLVEQILNTKTEYDTDTGGYAKDARSVSKPLFRSDQLRKMGVNEAVVLHGNHQPAKIEIPFFSDDEELKKWTTIKPFEFKSSSHIKNLEQVNKHLLDLKAFDIKK